MTVFQQEHSAAVALVNARTPAAPSTNPAMNTQSEDPDLQRAFKLVELHNEVKVKHAQGEDQGLGKARRDVKDVMEGLRREGVI